MTTTEHEPVLVVDGDVVHVDGLPMPRPLAHPPARVPRSPAWCRCGKRDAAAHGGFTCDEVRGIAARVRADEARQARPRVAGPAAGVLAVVAAVVLIALAIVAAVSLRLTGAVAAVTAWVATWWPLALVGLLFLGGGAATCAGLHCGGCRG
ncbi:hypothetical protein [Pseudonocardia nigra]|uniref:hypothetical protein n=1 Tax=Pseudonocardia nigra TaxID=1921578 RepID=UPI001C5E59E2|nr:hypothetical protein [Pseudonocardia nigra]